MLGVGIFVKNRRIGEMNVRFIEALIGKRVLFITTKNIDYIRNSQEIRILEQQAESVTKIYSDRKKYINRIIEIWMQLLKVRMTNYDVIFIGFAPQLIFPFYKKFRGKIIIIDFFISVYDTLINDRKRFGTKSIVARFSHWLDCYVIKKADYVITDTRADAKYFIEEFYGGEEKYETLYLEADSSIYYVREQYKPQSLRNKFVVLYFGSILPLQGVNVVLEAVTLLKDKENIHIQIIGPISNLYKKPMQENVEYIDWLSQEKLAEYIANADLCLAGHFNADIDKAKRTIPGKAYIYETMGKKMVLGDNEANREYFQKNEKHMFVKMGEAEEIVKVINILSKEVIINEEKKVISG